VRRLALAVTAALLLAAGLASYAAARVVVQRSIAGVKMGMTQAKVRSVLGRPSRVVHGSNEFGRYVEFRYFGLAVTFQGEATATNVRTTRASERTASGIGVGSSRADVMAKIAGVHCSAAICTVGRFLPGRKVTTFFIKRGVVFRIALGLVID
jgi:hypothetical protein